MNNSLDLGLKTGLWPLGEGEGASIGSAAFPKVSRLVNKFVEVRGHGTPCSAPASFHSLVVAGAGQGTLGAPNPKAAGYVL